MSMKLGDAACHWHRQSTSAGKSDLAGHGNIKACPATNAFWSIVEFVVLNSFRHVVIMLDAYGEAAGGK
jgi:hypothetical protein